MLSGAAPAAPSLVATTRGRRELRQAERAPRGGGGELMFELSFGSDLERIGVEGWEGCLLLCEWRDGAVSG